MGAGGVNGLSVRRSALALTAGFGLGPVVAAGLATAANWDQGIADLRRTADDGGTFNYTFFKGHAVNP